MLSLTTLPEEIILSVFAFVPRRDLRSLCLVSRQLSRIATPELWRTAWAKTGTVEALADKPENKQHVRKVAMRGSRHDGSNLDDFCLVLLFRLLPNVRSLLIATKEYYSRPTRFMYFLEHAINGHYSDPRRPLPQSLATLRVATIITGKADLLDPRLLAPLFLLPAMRKLEARYVDKFRTKPGESPRMMLPSGLLAASSCITTLDLTYKVLWPNMAKLIMFLQLPHTLQDVSLRWIHTNPGNTEDEEVDFSVLSTALSLHAHSLRRLRIRRRGSPCLEVPVAQLFGSVASFTVLEELITSEALLYPSATDAVSRRLVDYLPRSMRRLDIWTRGSNRFYTHSELTDLTDAYNKQVRKVFKKCPDLADVVLNRAMKWKTLAMAWRKEAPDHIVGEGGIWDGELGEETDSSDDGTAAEEDGF